MRDQSNQPTASISTRCRVTRSCIGWRFAILEMQAFLVEMVNQFEFSMTPESHAVRREACALLMVPTIEGGGMRRRLPLSVKIAPQDD